MVDFEQAQAALSPSLSQTELERYQRLRAQFSADRKA